MDILAVLVVLAFGLPLAFMFADAGPNVLFIVCALFGLAVYLVTKNK